MTCKFRRDLSKAEFLVADEKRLWQLSQWMTQLGHNIDLCDMSLDMTEERKDEAFRCIAFLLRFIKPFSRKNKWLGILASMHLVISREHTKRHRSTTLVLRLEWRRDTNYRSDGR